MSIGIGGAIRTFMIAIKQTVSPPVRNPPMKIEQSKDKTKIHSF